MIAALLAALLLADFFTGLLHWAEDTYCYKDILPRWLDRSICAPNLRHHIDQADCTKHSFIETIKISALIAIIPGLAALYYGLYVLGAALLISPLGAQVHIWSHKRSQFTAVRLLQDMCILQTPAQHAAHHKWPHTSYYCTFTNWLNPLLDLGFWRLLERALYYIFGLEVKQLRRR